MTEFEQAILDRLERIENQLANQNGIHTKSTVPDAQSFKGIPYAVRCAQAEESARRNLIKKTRRQAA